jgi:type VI secretion system secreted protein VgrG
MQFLPRVGTEVAVAFMDGDPDRPVVVGGLYNGNAKPPFALPAQKTRLGLRTRSSLAGGSADYSEFSIDDAKGQEQILLHAQKDHAVEVENCQSISVGAVRTLTVGTEEHVTIAKGNTQATNSGTVTFSTDVMEGDATLAAHNGQYTVTAKKPVAIESLSDNITLTADQKDVQISAPNGKIAEKSPTLTRDGTTITDTADTSIELKVGSNSIKITKDGIEISAAKITITGSTSAELTSSGQTVIKGSMVMIN